MPAIPLPPDQCLDPTDWPAFRALAQKTLDAAIDKMEHAREGRVWTELPPELKQSLQSALPDEGRGLAAVQQQIETLLP